MRIDRSFGWLGRFPLAVDLADTVRVVGGEEVDLLVDEDALSTWVTAELPRFPVAGAASGRLVEVRSLRDSVRGLLLRVARGEPIPAEAVYRINEASRRCPNFPRWDPRGRMEVVELNEDLFQVFSAEVARSTIDMLRRATELTVCGAPSCGMLFVPGNRRQTWCSPSCGNRARVARHAARTGHAVR